jgi:aminoglycoside phosphotransferase (APT) family kinase protein
VIDLEDKGGAVREGEALDLPKVEGWLRTVLPDLEGPAEITQYAGGASNWTYRLRYRSHDLVLRRPPAGTKAKGAHDMAREYRIQAALGPVYPYVPKLVGLCEDPAILGATFYVMERKVGIIPRKNLPRGLDLDRAQTRQLCLSVIDRLVELHAVDVNASGLAMLGKGPGYPKRQIDGWNDRFVKARTWNVPGYQRVRDWLRERTPADSGTAMIHNDFRFDNVVLAADEPSRVIGVLDWELATVGDPLMDPGAALAYWVEADDDFIAKKLRRQPTHLPGMLTRDEVVAYYAEKSGRSIANWSFYEVYGLFRVAVILQQIYYRYHHKQTRNPAFKNFWIMSHYFHWRCRRIIAKAKD